MKPGMLSSWARNTRLAVAERKGRLGNPVYPSVSRIPEELLLRISSHGTRINRISSLIVLHHNLSHANMRYHQTFAGA